MLNNFEEMNGKIKEAPKMHFKSDFYTENVITMDKLYKHNII